MLASIVAAVIVPVGFAISPDSTQARSRSQPQVLASTLVSAPVLVRESSSSPSSAWPFVPEGAQLMVAGGVLLAVAAVVRRAG